MEYKEIIEIIKDNSQNGVEVLFNLYAESFYGYAVNKWYFSEDEAYEIVYATLDKLIERLPESSFSSHSKFEAYVNKVFRSHLSKRYQKKKRSQKKMPTVSIDEFATQNYIEDNSFDRTDVDLQYNFSDLDSPRIKNLKKALMHLSEFEIELLYLKAENNTYREIAQRLNVNYDGLKVKHYRAKEKLITKMKKIKTT